jgi:hypothetical protein
VSSEWTDLLRDFDDVGPSPELWPAIRSQLVDSKPRVVRRRARATLAWAAAAVGLAALVAALAFASRLNRATAPASHGLSPARTRALADASSLTNQIGEAGFVQSMVIVLPHVLRNSDHPQAPLVLEFTGGQRLETMRRSAFRRNVLLILNDMTRRANADLAALGAPPATATSPATVPRSDRLVAALTEDAMALRVARRFALAPQPASAGNDVLAPMRRWTVPAQRDLDAYVHAHPDAAEHGPVAKMDIAAAWDLRYARSELHQALERHRADPATADRLSLIGNMAGNDRAVLSIWALETRGASASADQLRPILKAYQHAVPHAIYPFPYRATPRKHWDWQHVGVKLQAADHLFAAWLREHPSAATQSLAAPPSVFGDQP